MALLTTAERKVYLPNQTGSVDDTTIDTMGARADALLAMWCGFPSVLGVYSMESTTYTAMRLDGPGGTVLRLPVRPGISITSIYDDPDWTFGSSTLVASTDYELDVETGEVHLLPSSTHGEWSSGPRNIKITFVAGYATVPAGLKHAAGLLSRHLFRSRREAGNVGVSGQAGSVSTETPRLDVPREVRIAAIPYMVRVAALGVP